MPLIVMDTDDPPEGYTDTEYKKFKIIEDSTDSESGTDSESESEDDTTNEPKGYKREKYKKLVKVEELLPE